MTAIHSFVQTAAVGTRAPTQNEADQGDDFATLWLAEDAAEDAAKDVPIESQGDPLDVAILGEGDETDIPIHADIVVNETPHPSLPNDVALSVGGHSDVASSSPETRAEPPLVAPTDPSVTMTGSAFPFVVAQVAQVATTGSQQSEPTTHLLDQPTAKPATPPVAAHGVIAAQPTKDTANLQPPVTPAAGHILPAPKDSSVKITREKVADIVKPTTDQHQVLPATPRELPVGVLPISTQSPTQPSTLSAPIPTSAFQSLDADEPRVLSTEQGLLQSVAPTSSTPARAQAAHPLQAHAQQVAQQIATATVQSAAGTTEISLNPEELGRVRMSLTSTESGISVSIVAERPETADLMRRNIELLMREFRDFGYGEASFSFGEQAEGSDQGQGHGPSDQSDTALDDQAPLHTTTTVALRGGLDLKL